VSGKFALARTQTPVPQASNLQPSH